MSRVQHRAFYVAPLTHIIGLHLRYLKDREEGTMKRLHRLWHALFGHRNLTVDLTNLPWSASCDCGYRLHVTEFSLGAVGVNAGG
jgi:hypothetical protein